MKVSRALSPFGGNSWHLLQVNVPNVAAWAIRTPELFALLAASARQLLSLEHYCPYHKFGSSAVALPADVGRLSQLTSLTLDLGASSVTGAQVTACIACCLSLHLPAVVCVVTEDRESRPYL